MGEREGEVTRVLRKVATTLGSGKFDEALRDLLHLSEKYPDAGEIPPQIAEVLLRRGESRARRGKMKEARDDFERSLRWQHKPAALVALARGHLREGRFEEADKLLNEALEVDDRYGPTHEAIGELLMGWQEFAQAARAFEQALGCGYATPDLYLGAWQAYSRMERFDRAQELILEGADKFGDHDGIQTAAGESFVTSRGEWAEARPYWERAVALNPANFDALWGLATEAAVRGARAEALKALQRCADLDLERARKAWREDAGSPLSRFADFVRDAEFRRALGWQND